MGFDGDGYFPQSSSQDAVQNVQTGAGVTITVTMPSSQNLVADAAAQNGNGNDGGKYENADEDDEDEDEDEDEDGEDGEDDDDNEHAIDANEFDLMLSRSFTSGTSGLEVEPVEYAMLRGPRRLSNNSSASGKIKGKGKRINSAPGTARRRRWSATLSDRRTTADWFRRPTTERTPLLAAAASGSTNPDATAGGGGNGAPHTSNGTITNNAAEAENGDNELESNSNNNNNKSKSPFLGGVSRTQFWLIFIETQATYFIACFDGTVMASSHPAITSHFGAAHSAAWLSTAFLLTCTACQPLLGRLSDSTGRKGPYLVTTALFLLATLWCALARSITEFILARALCGLGAGGMMALGSILVSDLVPIEIRGPYQSIMNMVYGVGAMLGAALGGAMVDSIGWRWEFGVQVPAILLCLAVAVVTIPDDIGRDDAVPPETFGEAMRAFDFVGSGLMVTSVTFLILGLNLGGNVLPWSHPFIVVSLVIFAICFPLFLYAETRALRPIMPLHLILKSPHMNLILSNHIAAFLANAILFNIPLFFQAVLLTSATTSGLRLVLPSAVASATGAATGFLIGATRRLKWPLLLGSGGLFLGTISLAAMPQSGWPAAAYLACLIPSSIGQGAQFPGTFMAVLAASEQRAQAVVTSTLILWRSLGAVLGVAASSLVVQNALLHYLHAYVQGPEADAVIARIRRSVEAVAALPEPYRAQVVASYAAALRLTFSLCAVLAFVSVLLILPLRLPKLASRK